MFPGQSVAVTDVDTPVAPKTSYDALVDYLTNCYTDRLKKLHEQRERAQAFVNKKDIVDLGFSVLEFSTEIDGWIAVAERLMEEEHGEQIDHAYTERTDDAKRQGTRVPAADLIKSRAAQHVAPLKEAVSTLKATRKTLSETLSFVQSIQKSTTNEEFGEMFAADHDAPGHMYEQAPVGSALRKNS